MSGRGGTFVVVEHIGAQPGPTVSVLAGIHGDEEEGVLAVQRVDAALRRDPPMRGTVRTVAVAHPAAYATGRRTSPLDGRDLARCFPGDPAGGASMCLAHSLTDRVIRGSDLLIDLHSAGRDYAMPMFVGYVDTGDDVAARARSAALAFAAPLIWEHAPPMPPGRTLSAALEQGIPSIYVEGSGGGSVELDELRLYIDGVLAVLADLNVIHAPVGVGDRVGQMIRGGAGDLDCGVVAASGGRFVASRAAGDIVAAGDQIGQIVDDAGEAVEVVEAHAAATVVFLRRATRVSEGDIICGLAPPATPWGAE